MLPNETLCDVFRWLDRRCLELNVRLASKKAGALIASLPGGWPRLCLPAMTIYHSNDSILFEVHVGRRNWPNKTKPKIRRPFPMFEPDWMPSYLLFGRTFILQKKSIKQLKKKLYRSDALHVYNLKVVRMIRPGYRACIMFEVPNLLKAKLNEYAWGEAYQLHDVPKNARLFTSLAVRTCTTLIVTGPIHAVFSLLIDWLTTAAEPSHWNPNAAAAVKHMFLDCDKRENILALRDKIVEYFRDLKHSCAFHLIAITRLSSQPATKWYNTATQQTLLWSTQQRQNFLRCPSDDSFQDRCDKCLEPQMRRTLSGHDSVFE